MALGQYDLTPKAHDWSMWYNDSDQSDVFYGLYAWKFCFNCGIERRVYWNRWGYNESPKPDCPQ